MPEKSKAKAIQDISAAEESTERDIRITIIDDKAFEYHLVRRESVVRGILDPETPDVFIEVPCTIQGVKHAYLHTSRIGKFYLHDELSNLSDDIGKRQAVRKEERGG
jgi:hypothetical protein